MTSEPVNVLIAVICLVALVFAGGFSQAIVPNDTAQQFTIGPVDPWCPEDRIVRGCVPWNVSGEIWQIQLIRPFLEGMVSVNGTPTPTPSSDPSSNGGSGTPTTSEGSGRAVVTATTATGSNGTSGGIEGAPSTRTRSATSADDRAGGGIGLGRGIDWLLWPLLAGIGAVIALGIGLGLRGGSIGRPRDLLAVPGFARDVLLSVLVGGLTRLGSWLRAQWMALVELVATAFESTQTTPTRRRGRGVPEVIGVLLGLGRLPGVLLDWLLGDRSVQRPDETPNAKAEAGRTTKTQTGEFDVHRAWAWLAGRTAPAHPRSRTPEDIARDAVDMGFPRHAVNDLLAVFRDVTYGGFRASGDRLQTARHAYETLREADGSAVNGGD